MEYVNAVMCQMFGATRSQLLGKDISTIIPSPISELHAGFLRRLLSSGQPKVCNTTLAVLAQHSSGYIFPAAVTVQPGVGDAKPKFRGTSADPNTVLLYNTFTCAPSLGSICGTDTPLVRLGADWGPTPPAAAHKLLVASLLSSSFRASIVTLPQTVVCMMTSATFAHTHGGISLGTAN